VTDGVLCDTSRRFQSSRYFALWNFAIVSNADFTFMPGVHVFYTRTHARAHAYMCACDNVLYIYIFMSWAEMHCSLTHSQGIHTLNMYAVRMTTFARMRLKLLRVTAPYGNQHAGNIVAGCSNESSRSVSAWNLTEDVYEGAGNVNVRACLCGLALRFVLKRISTDLIMFC